MQDKDIKELISRVLCLSLRYKKARVMVNDLETLMRMNTIDVHITKTQRITEKIHITKKSFYEKSLIFLAIIEGGKLMNLIPMV